MKRAVALGLTLSITAAIAISLEAAQTQQGRSRRAGASKTTLARAIEIALREVPGEALQATIELERGKAIIEVMVAKEGKTFEVEIDGETGKVLEVEGEAGEDDDEEDDAADEDEKP